MPECFVICPFGEEGTKERERSDLVFKSYIKPIAETEGFSAFRSIDLEGTRPGVTTENVIEKLCNAELVIADLTGSNANVYYELALRHATGKPFIMLAEDTAEVRFDVKAFTLIPIRKDFAGGTRTQQELRQHIQRIKEGEGRVENPVSRIFDRGAKTAKVFVWRIAYAHGLAAEWLSRQDQAFLSCAKAFDDNRGIPSNPGHCNRLAHYVGYKFSQGQALSGRLFYHIAAAGGSFEGWGNFELTGSEPMAIKISGRESGPNDVEMNFSQPARPLEIAAGITEVIQAFNFSVKFVRRGRSLEGLLNHPYYPDSDPLLVGTTTLSPIE